MIEARSLSYSVLGRDLVHDITLGVCPGDVTAALGPNGAGKSTLLKLLSGELAPTGGQVLFDGRPLHSAKLSAIAKRRAVLPQESTLSFPFTALEIVLLGRLPHLRGSETRHDYRIAREAMQLTGVGHLENRHYPTLSGGERQRVHLARALAQIWECPGQPRFLLLDEPTSNLDLSHQHETLTIARNFAARGVGVLVILHDLNLASEYADRIVLLSGGTIHAQGSPVQALTEKHVRTVFNVDVEIIPHPKSGRPHVISLPRVAAAPDSSGGGNSTLRANIFAFRRSTKGFCSR